ncbi:hypothetical protein ACVWY0_001279 [Arthrobacter sp. UYNi723]
MTAFIQTDNGELLNVAGIAKLHIDYASTNNNEKAVYADRHRIGTAAPGGNLQKLLENFAVRTACDNGVFGIENGSIYRRYNVTETNAQRTIHYGTGENMKWDEDV